MVKKLMNFFKKEEGAGLAEYALLLVLIAVVCIAALQILGPQIASAFTTIAGHLGYVAPQEIYTESRGSWMFYEKKQNIQRHD